MLGRGLGVEGVEDLKRQVLGSCHPFPGLALSEQSAPTRLHLTKVPALALHRSAMPQSKTPTRGFWEGSDPHCANEGLQFCWAWGLTPVIPVLGSLRQ